MISTDLDEHAAHIQRYVDLGFTEIYLHNVGRNQEAFIKTFGEQVFPKVKGLAPTA